MPHNSSVKNLLFVLVFVIVIVSSGYGVLYAIRSASCLTETKQQATDAAGDLIETTYVACDTLAKDESINVFISKAPYRYSLLNKWFRKKTLLFQYDPGGPTDYLPTITQKSSTVILIAVPEVSSISVERKTWGDIEVEYAIGHVIYPTPEETHPNH